VAGNIANLKPWKPGQSGRAGHNSLPPEIRSERKRNQAALIRLVILYFGLSQEEARKRLDGPESTQLEEAIQGMISRAKEGDTNSFKYLTELICGKIPETDPDDRGLTEEMTKEEKIAALKQAIEVLEKPDGSTQG